jgi:hypothetical protein
MSDWTNHPLLSLFLFLLVVFVYIHMVAQWKKSEDLEIYEMDYVNATHLHEICAVKQPVMFEFIHNPAFYQRIQLSKMEKFDNYDIKIKDTRDYWKPSHQVDTPTVDYVVLPFHSAQKLMESDTNSRYISENNSEFMEITGLEYVCSSMDTFLKPPLNLYSKYDLMVGSKHATTPLRYHTNACYFVAPTAGKIRVKMTPWKSSRYLHPVKDYDQYEFRSTVNIWNPAPNHKNDMDKLRFLDFEVHSGHILSIPPYWWYSIRYSTDSDTCVCGITYDTIINAMAHSYDWIQYYMQQNRMGKKGRETEDTEIALSLDSSSPTTPDELLSRSIPDAKRKEYEETPEAKPSEFAESEGRSKLPQQSQPVLAHPSQVLPDQVNGITPNSYELRSPSPKGDRFPRTPSAARPEYFTNLPSQNVENAASTSLEKREIITNAGIYQIA